MELVDDHRVLFDDCIQEAIKLGRRYMNDTTMSKKPTSQEWDLAVVLFTNQLNTHL